MSDEERSHWMADIRHIMRVKDAEIDRLRAELAEITAALPTDRYSGSKDWRESNVLGRIEWLHSMYASASAEAELWLTRLTNANAELKYQTDNSANLQSSIEGLHGRIRELEAELTEARKPDCRLCMNIMGCQVTAPDAITCRDGSEYFAAASLRLYEKEVIATEPAATATRLWGGDAHEM